MHRPFNAIQWLNASKVGRDERVRNIWRKDFTDYPVHLGCEEMTSEIFDLEHIKNKFISANIEEDDDGNKIKSVFLGTVMDLTPSGKYYTPFANSNIEKCPRCNGSGLVVNKRFDRGEFYKLWTECGILTQHMINCFGPYCEGKWPADLKKILDRKRKKMDHSRSVWNCPRCDGVGSEEVKLDIEWHRQAERELATINAVLEPGQGDPCDLYAVMLVVKQ